MALSLTVLQPAWMAHARCREADPALFYPRSADQSFYAKRVCDSCPVAAECLDFALDTAELRRPRRVGRTHSYRAPEAPASR